MKTYVVPESSVIRDWEGELPLLQPGQKVKLDQVMVRVSDAWVSLRRDEDVPPGAPLAVQFVVLAPE